VCERGVYIFKTHYTLDINKSGAPFDGIFKKRGARETENIRKKRRRKENTRRGVYLSHLPAAGKKQAVT
jgi:hypothetical protein